MYSLFAVCAPGLEPFLRQELNACRLLPDDRSPTEESGGIGFSGELTDIYAANLHLLTATRILLRMGEFYAVSFPELKRKVRHLSWENFLEGGRPIVLRVTCHKSRLYHSGAVAERVAAGIGDRLGRLPPLLPERCLEEPNPPQLIVVRLVRNRCTISLDTSGAALYRRGYRQATAKAPLRETLAAGMLMASGWDGASPLLDPFCGSGTIPIEAALLSRGIAPGSKRDFAFMKWRIYDEDLWQTLLQQAKARETSPTARIQGSDRDAGAINAANANAERAGVAADIQFSCIPFSAIEPPSETGWIVANPPYGVRTGPKKELRNLYARFGNIAREKCRGWRVALLCNSPFLAQHTGFHFDRRIPLNNGGIKVVLLVGNVG